MFRIDFKIFSPFIFKNCNIAFVDLDLSSIKPESRADPASMADKPALRIRFVLRESILSWKTTRSTSIWIMAPSHSDHSVTVEHKHQEHDAIEVCEVVGSLGGHGLPSFCRINFPQYDIIYDLLIILIAKATVIAKATRPIQARANT